MAKVVTETATSSSSGLTDAVVAAVTLGLPVALCGLVLLERKTGVMFGRAPFLLTERLSWWEVVLFILICCAEVLMLQLGASWIAQLLFSRAVFEKHPSLRWSAFSIIAFCYLPVLAVEYQAFQYFKDSIDLALVRTLAGGNLLDGVAYIQNELVGLLPFVLGAGVLFGAGVAALTYYGQRLADWLSTRRIVNRLSTLKSVMIMNGLLVLAAPIVALALPSLDFALRRNLVHLLYLAPGIYLTDFDGDGYGWVQRPFDFAPFDPTRHPYAVDIPGNGIDEDGVGGDLPAVEWSRAPRVWDAARLQGFNVLMIVLESARYDLLAQRVNSSPVMPTLESLSGDQLAMFSHAAFTTPSVTSIFNGTVSTKEQGISLVDRFRALDYQTAVFSGQSESFGNIDSITNMHHADMFVDATHYSREMRMYSGTTPASLQIPARTVNTKLIPWLRSVDTGHPFFAYVNYQEMHFPYYYYGEPTPLVAHFIPRADIVAEQGHDLRLIYWNAARQVDNAIAEVITVLRDMRVFETTIILVLGDHGEELFDLGYLGHGTNLSYEQYLTTAKVIHSRWKAPQIPIGQNEVTDVLYNAMLRSQADAVTLDPEVLSYVGNARTPRQVGLFTTAGLVKYDFIKDAWSKQAGPGRGFERSEPVPHVIHKWESYVIAGLKAH